MISRGVSRCCPRRPSRSLRRGPRFIELAGPVDTVDRAQPGTPASQFRPHRDADLRPRWGRWRQRLQSGVLQEMGVVRLNAQRQRRRLRRLPDAA